MSIEEKISKIQIIMDILNTKFHIIDEPEGGIWPTWMYFIIPYLDDNCTVMIVYAGYVNVIGPHTSMLEWEPPEQIYNMALSQLEDRLKSSLNSYSKSRMPHFKEVLLKFLQ